jgi:L-ascorbate metabolism protein UlaG (beta-lactamase superfamily)
MKIQLIRNATLRINFGGKTFLIDPYLADPYSQPSFSGKSLNPTVALPMPVNEIIKSVDYVVISHLHPDHFDDAAKSLLPKEISIFCQPEDREDIVQAGFQNVKAINDSFRIGDIYIHRILGLHGNGRIGELMGIVSGFVFRHKNEKTLYWIGDSIWHNNLQEAIFKFNPEIIVCHAGGNRFFKEQPIFGDAFSGDSEPVIMDANQVVQLSYYALTSKIIATHMGALDHETVTRNSLREVTMLAGFQPDRLLIPYDGETLKF